MSKGVLLRGSAVALGMAAFVSFAAPYAHADADVPMPPQRNATVAVTAPAPSPIPATSAGADALRTVPQDNTTASANSNSAMPSLAEPAPTPGWAESHQALDANASSSSVVANAVTEQQAPTSGVTRRSASPHYYRTSGNPVAHAARNVVGGVADVGAVVAYPVYCFPNYGRCPVKVPYRF